jgi:SsrA-binding protein
MKVTNRTWFRDYEAIEDLEAGIVLTGAEAKSVYDGKIKLEAAHVKIVKGEVWLHNAEIFKYQFDGNKEYDQARRRKLLLNRKEIIRWETKMQSQPGLTMVPTECYTKGNRIKIKIALVKGRKETEKRRQERNKKIVRKQEQELKNYLKR